MKPGKSRLFCLGEYKVGWFYVKRRKTHSFVERNNQLCIMSKVDKIRVWGGWRGLDPFVL